MIDFLWNTLWGWWGVTGVILVVCGVIAWLIPTLRLTMIEAALAVLAVVASYTKGNRDQANLEQRRKDEAVQKAKEDYAKIDARPDTPDDVAKRLRDNNF